MMDRCNQWPFELNLDYYSLFLAEWYTVSGFLVESQGIEKDIRLSGAEPWQDVYQIFVKVRKQTFL
eukprot:c34285_g1_i1 orf=28-225(+)